MSSATYNDSAFKTMSFSAFKRKPAQKKEPASSHNARTTGTTGKKDKKIILLKIIVVVLLVLLGVEGILYTVIIPTLVPVKIHFSGVKNLTVDDLMQQLNLMGTNTWIQFDSAKAVELLSAIPSIDKVSVDKHFPDKVSVKIEEREAVARTIVPAEDGKLASVQIDKNGVLFTSSFYAAEGSAFATIPLVSGLPIEQARDGMRVPAKFRPLMEQIAAISAVNPRYFEAISEIQVIPKEYGNYELILYPVYTRVRVLTDRALTEDALKSMMVVLDVVNSIEPDVSEVDLRYGAVSYRKR